LNLQSCRKYAAADGLYLANRFCQVELTPGGLRMILAEQTRPARVSLLGGEPLLHPRLIKVRDTVRESGLSDCIRVVAGGALPRRRRM